MTTITIQPGQAGKGMDYDPLVPLPYPFHIKAENGRCEHGRGTSAFPGDDPTGVTPWVLLGFQAGDVQELVLTRDEWIAEPQGAVGLFPVFIDWRGSIFNLSVPITDVSVPR